MPGDAGTATAERHSATEEPPDAPVEVGHFEDLEVNGHPSAVVWVPAGQTSLPLIVVAHGAGGGPEWHCEFWSAVVRGDAFLACLRGHEIRTGTAAHYFPEHHTLGRIFRATVSAVDARYEGRIAKEQGVYIGYSQGATMGSLMLATYARRFSHALYIEGGFKTWSIARARAYHDAGGQAVFIACGTSTCDRNAKNAVRWLERVGLSARSETAQGAGHTPDGEVGLAAIEGLSWLLQN